MNPVLKRVWLAPKGRFHIRVDINGVTAEIASDGQGGVTLLNKEARKVWDAVSAEVREEILRQLKAQ